MDRAGRAAAGLGLANRMCRDRFVPGSLEVVIGAMGVIYNLGDEQDEESEPLRERLREVTWDGTDRPVYNVPVALSILVFFALCAQCAATLVIIRRETNSWRWPTFTFFYMTGLAYVAALLTYQIGMAIVS
ncbi:MAG: nucleoside recognition domain-containing protein [Pirellulaceae bacterium]